MYFISTLFRVRIQNTDRTFRNFLAEHIAIATYRYKEMSLKVSINMKQILFGGKITSSTELLNLKFSTTKMLIAK